MVTATKEPEVKDKPKAKAPKKKQADNLRPGIQQIHHVIRTISREGSGSGGAWNVGEIEQYLAGYLNNGWRVSATHYLGELPEGYSVLWVLLKG